MVTFGIVLIAVGVLAVLAAIFVSEGRAELLGMDLDAVGIFLAGVAAGASILWGFSILKYGTRRGLQARKERRELETLHEKLDRVESDRRRDDDPERGRPER